MALVVEKGSVASLNRRVEGVAERGTATPDASSDADVTPAEAAPGATAPTSPTSPLVHKVTTKRRTRGARDPARNFTRAFAKRRERVERCFTDHVSKNAADASAEVWIRFEVGLDGRVVSAEVLPDALSKTPLAACVLGVAKATHFGPQPEVVSFRIPIRVRRDNG